MGWFSRKKAAPVEDCPRKGDICIYVYRLDTGAPVKGVKVSVAGASSGQSPTDDNGFAEFTDREPGPYQFGIALPGNMTFYKIEPYGPDLSVSAGTVATATVAVYPTGRLVVQVYDDLNRLVTESARLDASGPESLTQRVQTGTHTFPDVMCGAYTATAAVPSHLYDPYQGTAANVVVPDGGQGTARINVRLLNIVDPEIKADEHEVWFTAPPPDDVQGAPVQGSPGQGGQQAEKKNDDEPVHIRLSYKESRPEKPFKDGGLVEFHQPLVDVFTDKGCKSPFALDMNHSARLSNGQLSAGLDLYLRGKAEGLLSPTLTLDKPADASIRVNGPVTESIEVKAINVVEPKIEMEYKVVLADPDLAKHQDAKKSDGTTDEEKIVADNVTYIEVSAKASRATPKYTKGGKLEVTSGADKVKIYTDMRRTKLLDRPLTNAELFGAQPFILYVASVKDKEGEFKLKLTLDPSGDPHIVVKEMKDVEMAVVKLDLKLHQHKDAIVDEEFDADKDTLDDYFTALKDKVIPDQELMTDEKQVKPGRLLHVQKDGHHGRAKLLLKKLTATWPGGTDDYYVIVDQECDSGAISLWDKETEGVKKDLPFKIKVSELKKADVELWVEGTTATKLWRDVVLGAGIDREDGGLAKEPKHNGDWARFTVVQVKEVKLAYKAPDNKANAWDSGQNRFYINLENDPGGRKIKLAVELTEKLKDVPIHFMLAPHKDNGKKANWGEDLPSTWKWKDIEEAVKHKDRSAQKKLLHLSKKSDADGKAELEVTLSRFGGDVFEPGAYITQDPHLAKYVRAHGDLEKRKPVVAAHTITVWRKFWYQVVRAEGLNFPGMGGAVGQYRTVKAEMIQADDVDVSTATIQSMSPRALYKKYMVYVGAGAEDALVVSDANKAQFFSGVTTETDKPVKIPILVCDAQWDAAGNSGAKSEDDIPAANFPVDLTVDKLVIDPPLQGGTLFVSGRWRAAEWDPAANGGTGDWANQRNGNLAAGDITVNASRTGLKDVTVKLPAGVGPVTAATSVDIVDLVIRGAKGPYLGEYSRATKRILCVYNQKSQLYIDDFQNTVAHELGHAFRQVLTTLPAGVVAHPHQFESQGSHCSWSTNKCLMYKSGPIVGCINQYCEVCHPYVLVSEMATLS